MKKRRTTRRGMNGRPGRTAMRSDHELFCAINPLEKDAEPADTAPGASPGEGFFWLDRLRHQLRPRRSVRNAAGCGRAGGPAAEEIDLCRPALLLPGLRRSAPSHGKSNATCCWPGRRRQRPHRVPLGLLLVSRGLISSAQLQEALERQRERPGARLGACSWKATP